MAAALLHVVLVRVAREVEQSAASVRVPLIGLRAARAVLVRHAVLQSRVVEAEAVMILVRQRLVAQDLVQDPRNDRMIEQHLWKMEWVTVASSQISRSGCAVTPLAGLT